VEKILVDSGRATGVRLENGEEIPAGRLVASGVDPGQFVLRFLGEEVVGPEIAGKMGRYEWGDSAFVIYAALDGPAVARSRGQSFGRMPRRRTAGNTPRGELERLGDRPEPGA
jgi:phytoene dehydrogenase-like protein